MMEEPEDEYDMRTKVFIKCKRCGYDDFLLEEEPKYCKRCRNDWLEINFPVECT